MYPTVFQKEREKKRETITVRMSTPRIVYPKYSRAKDTVTRTASSNERKTIVYRGCVRGKGKEKQKSVNREPKIFHSWDVERMRLFRNAFVHGTDSNFRVRAAATFYVKFEDLDVVDDARIETQRNVYNIYIYSSQ